MNIYCVSFCQESMQDLLTYSVLNGNSGKTEPKNFISLQVTIYINNLDLLIQIRQENNTPSEAFDTKKRQIDRKLKSGICEFS